MVNKPRKIKAGPVEQRWEPAATGTGRSMGQPLPQRRPVCRVHDPGAATAKAPHPPTAEADSRNSRPRRPASNTPLARSAAR